MRFARKYEQRVQAQPGLFGECPSCEEPMVAKCGKQRVWHWAHKGRLNCDSWQENETEWHRKWKDKFPEEWQEIVHRADDGERHIADVKTYEGWVLEFQHSRISYEERRSRETYYQSLIWVVDGTTRKKDARQFFEAWNSGGKSPNPFSTKRRIAEHNSALLRDWKDSQGHVFFDFGEENQLWWLYPQSDETRAYVQAISRDQFIRVHRERTSNVPTEFEQLVNNFTPFIATYEEPSFAPHPLRKREVTADRNCDGLIRGRTRL